MKDAMVDKAKEIGIRLSVWGIVIGIVLVIFGICKFFTWMAAPVPTTYVNYNDNNIKEFSSIEKVGISGYSIDYNQVEEPVAFVDIPGLKKDGYVEYEKNIFSPIIMYVGESALNAKTGFSVSDTNYSSTAIKVQKNLSTILLAMEQDKTWEDIGIDKSCLEGKIVLSIPDKYSSYRKLIKDLFILNLAEDKVTDSNYEELEQRANNLLDKCIQVEEPKSYLVTNKEKDSVGKVILIAPEYLLNFDNDYIFSTSYSDGKQEKFVPAYPTRTTAITYSLYVKKDIEEELKTAILDSFNGSTISKKTGFRTVKYGSKYLSGYNIVNDIDVQYIKEKPTSE